MMPCPLQKFALLVASVSFLAGAGAGANPALSALESGWANPPRAAQIRAYWWWLNGNVTRESITRDLEEMKAKGFGGALICDAGGAEQGGNDRVPAGPTFFSTEWRALYKHSLREANRLDLEMSLNIQSGWNIGGPMTRKEDSVKVLTWSETVASGPGKPGLKLPQPVSRENFYRDLFVVAYQLRPGHTNRVPLKDWRVKALYEKLKFTGPDAWFLANSAPDTRALINVEPSVPGEEDAGVGDVLDLTGKLSADGKLNWAAPAGDWQVLRFGYTLGEINHVSTSSDGWKGYAIDVLDEGALKRYWDAVVEPLIADAGPLAGTTLKYLHTDSWETGVHNWTTGFRDEFKKRRGYDLLPWMPVMTGRIVNSREQSDCFLHDFRKTLGDLAIDRHYRPYQQWAARHGLGIHPESGGPHFVPVDAQRALGLNDVPMSEFWATAATHRRSDQTRFFVKQPAAAAHVYGKKIVAAEGFTTVGPHWQETLWDNLKPSFDKAICEGLNRLVWHAFVCSPKEMGLPGQQYFAGTHLNPNVTWWEKSAPFFAYLNRSQWMMQQGLFVADAAYYYGDHVPNFTQLKNSDPARLGLGYDYDVMTEEAILTRLTVKDDRLVLPDGMSYRVLVLPEREAISLPVLRKVQELVEAGATVVGPRPLRANSLQNFPASDTEVARLADQLWGQPQIASANHKVGKGRIITGKTAREVLLDDGILPDFENVAAPNSNPAAPLDYIHRRDGTADIYFVASRTNTAQSALCAFRVQGKAPELWNAVTGQRRFAGAYEERDGRVFVPLEFDPCGSWIVVFREPSAQHPALTKRNERSFVALQELTGAWTVRFDTNWAGPAATRFDRLESWTVRPEPGIKFFSGTATYTKTFDVPDSQLQIRDARLFLDLGKVRELAEVRINGKPCGIVWAPPFRVDITHAVKPDGNTLEIDVVNFWPNRIIGDANLARAQRRTRTNIRKLTAGTPLMESGLFGPVRLLQSAP